MYPLYLLNIFVVFCGDGVVFVAFRKQDTDKKCSVVYNEVKVWCFLQYIVWSTDLFFWHPCKLTIAAKDSGPV